MPRIGLLMSGSPDHRSTNWHEKYTALGEPPSPKERLKRFRDTVHLLSEMAVPSLFVYHTEVEE